MPGTTLTQPDSLNPARWGASAAPVSAAVAAFALAHLLLTPLSINLPLAAGAVLPLLACGAALGRLAGVFSLSSGALPSSLYAAPAVYAAVGAASLLGAGTGTLSAAVMVTEVRWE